MLFFTFLTLKVNTYTINIQNVVWLRLAARVDSQTQLLVHVG